MTLQGNQLDLEGPPQPAASPCVAQSFPMAPGALLTA